MAAEPLTSDDYPKASVLWAWIACVLVLSLVILGFTPYTNNLDDVKVTFLHIGGGGLLALFAWLWMRNEMSLPSRWVTILVTAWLADAILVSLLHQLGLIPRANPYQWIGWILIGQHLALFGIFLIHGCAMRTFRMVELTLLFWVVVTFGECAFGMLHYSGFFKVVYNFLYLGQPPRTAFASLIYTFNSSQDMLGTVLNRQFFGDLLTLWAPLCLAGAIIWHDPRRKLLCIIALALTFPCMYLTFSKPILPLYVFALLGTVVGTVTLTHYRHIRIPHLPVVAAGVVLIVGTLVFFTIDQIADRFKTMGTSMDSRNIIWAGGIDIFKQHPLVGSGIGSFRVLFPEVRNQDYHLTQISNVTLSAHNQVVDLLSEQGIIGTLLFYLFFGATLFQAYRVIRHGTDERLKVIAIALTCGLLAFVGASLFHPGVRWVIGATPFWAALGMLACLGEAEKWHAEETAGPRHRPARLTSRQRNLRLAAVVVALLIWVNPFPLSRPFLLSNFGYGVRYFAGAEANNNGLIYTQSNRPQEAIREFDRALAWNPTFITSYYKKAHAQNMLAKHEDSKASYEDLMRYAPDYSEVHYNFGVINRILSSDLQREALQIADAAERKKRVDRAYELIEASREQFALAAKMCNKISVQYQYAQALRESAAVAKTPEDRLKLTREAAAVYDRIRGLAFTLATQEENQLETEEQQKEAAARMAPLLFEEIGDYARAADAYRALFRLVPGKTEYMGKAVEMFTKAGQMDEAKDTLERALTRSPLNFEARNALAELLMAQKSPADLQAAYRQSIILDQLDREFPGQISAAIRTANEQRLARLRRDLALAEATP